MDDAPTTVGGAVLSGEILPARPASPIPTAAAGDIEQLLRDWLLGYSSPNTRDAYRRDLQQWLGYLQASRLDPLTGVRRVHTYGWLRAMELDGASAATRARRLAAVSAFYDWLSTEDKFDLANPAAIDHKRKPRPPQKSRTASLTRQQVNDLLAAAAADTGPQARRAQAIVAMLLYTGLRVSELTGATIDQLGYRGAHRVLWVRPKGHDEEDHVVAIPPVVAGPLDAYLAARHDLAADRLPVTVGAVGARPRRPLIATTSGRPLDRGAVWRLLRRLAKAADVTVVMSPHVLRHTYVTLSRDAGVPIEDIQDGLGHADPRTTRRYDNDAVRLDRSPGYRLAAHIGADTAA